MVIIIYSAKTGLSKDVFKRLQKSQNVQKAQKAGANKWTKYSQMAKIKPFSMVEPN
jgi:hypothetical protein